MMIYKIQAYLIVLFMSLSIVGVIYLKYNAYNDDGVICSEEMSLEECEDFKKILRQRENDVMVQRKTL